MQPKSATEPPVCESVKREAIRAYKNNLKNDDDNDDDDDDIDTAIHSSSVPVYELLPPYT